MSSENIHIEEEFVQPCAIEHGKAIYRVTPLDQKGIWKTWDKMSADECEFVIEMNGRKNNMNSNKLYICKENLAIASIPLDLFFNSSFIDSLGIYPEVFVADLQKTPNCTLKWEECSDGRYYISLDATELRRCVKYLSLNKHLISPRWYDARNQGLALSERGNASVAQAPRISLLSVVRELYEAGKWTCDNLTESEQVRLWVKLRDAAGITKGTATKLGVAAKRTSKAKILPSLRACLKETRFALAAVTFFARNHSPDSKVTKEIEAILDRGRAALEENPNVSGLTRPDENEKVDS